MDLSNKERLLLSDLLGKHYTEVDSYRAGLPEDNTTLAWAKQELHKDLEEMSSLQRKLLKDLDVEQHYKTAKVMEG